MSTVGVFGDQFSEDHSLFFDRYCFLHPVETITKRYTTDDILKQYESLVSMMGEFDGDYINWEGLGKAYFKTQKGEPAVKFFEKALERVVAYNQNQKDPKNIEDMLLLVYRKHLIKACGLTKDEAKAKQHAAEMVKSDSTPYAKYLSEYSLGYYYFTAGNTEEAIKHYATAFNGLTAESYRGFSEELEEEFSDMSKTKAPFFNPSKAGPITNAIVERERAEDEAEAEEDEE